MPSTLIELKGAGKVYSSEGTEVVGLQPATLSLLPGEILGLLGPNGAGKTTMIKLLATVLSPTTGMICYDGVDTREMPYRRLAEVKRQIGYVSEVPFVYSLLSGREYLEFIGEIYGVRGEDLRRRLDEYLGLLDLESVQGRFLRSYSQGMVKKIALIASLLYDPSVLLWDEPMNALDPKAVAVIRGLLVRKRDEGKTIVLSTHNLDLAEALADRIAILDRGRLLHVEAAPDPGGNRTVLRTSRLEKVYLEVTGAPGDARGESDPPSGPVDA